MNEESCCIRVTLTSVLWFVVDNATVLDARRHRSVRPTPVQLSQLLSDQLSLRVITDDALTDSQRVRRSQCFRLVFRGDVRQYDYVGRVLWSAVGPRLANISFSDQAPFNASVVIVFNEEYIVPSEYVF